VEKPPPPSMTSPGVAIHLDKVAVQVSGHSILSDITLDVAAGSQVAIVGPSGAGKSTLVGLLLGWHRPASGQVCVDDALLTAATLEHLRRVTVWVDPTIQIWNRSLLDNVRYGNAVSIDQPLGALLEQADLLKVIEKLPDGLQTFLGEGGGLVSGGEGQRVRLGRALLRPEARLVILDEPFRGLDREARRRLLARVRQVWQGATLLCITHDMSETLEFERVVVVEHGRVIEDNSPHTLAAQATSRYHALLAAEKEVRESLWVGTEWRRLHLENGQLVEGQS
jgi:ATP-binding cassette subfamily B protein